MRTQLELWQVVKDNFEECFSTSLCILLIKLFTKHILSLEEHNNLHKELKRYGDTKDYFLGIEGDPKPRIEFIDKMIKKHSENAITENK